MAANYNLIAIRRMLSAAFSSSDIDTLAFDEFYELYGDLSGMKKTEKIREIVDYAHRNGRVNRLITYVKNKNGYQYRRFAEQLYAAPASQAGARPEPATRSLGTGDQQRLRDLHDHLERETALLKQYEEKLSYTSDPRELTKYEAEIRRQREKIEEYRREIAAIVNNAGLRFEAGRDVNIGGDVVAGDKTGRDKYVAGGDINITLNQEDKELLNQVLELINDFRQESAEAIQKVHAGQAQIRADLQKQEQAILAHIDQRHRESVHTVITKLDENQLETVELLVEAAGLQQIAPWETQALFPMVRQALKDIQQIRHNQPDAAEWQSLTAALENETRWDQKLKLMLPIIPGILAFESETAVDVIPALEQAWQRLVSKFQRK